MNQEWKQQEAAFTQFGQQACSKITQMESQRVELVNSLKNNDTPHASSDILNYLEYINC